jgi:hypothetical protein
LGKEVKMKTLLVVMWFFLYTLSTFFCEYFELIKVPEFWAIFGSFFTCLYYVGMEAIEDGKRK